jgi:predicted nucleic acid-binding Zn ribbon protein
VSRRAPRGLETALGHLEGDWAPATLLGDVQRVWERAVGTALAREARPVSAAGGMVTIACSSSLWAHELDLMSPTVIESLNAALGGPRVTRLRCTASAGRHS